MAARSINPTSIVDIKFFLRQIILLTTNQILRTSFCPFYLFIVLVESKMTD